MSPKDSVLWVIVQAFVLVIKILTAVVVACYRTLFPAAMKSLEGDVAVVTGAAHGIGRQLALQLGALGLAHIVIWDVNEDGAKETARQIVRTTGTPTKVFRCDVSDRQQVAEVAAATRKCVGEVSLVINNVGILYCKPLLKMSPEEVVRSFQVNVFSHFWTLAEFLPDFMKRKNGHVVTLCSVAGVVGTPNLTVYCATKHAIKGLIDTLAMELQQHGSTVRFTTAYPYTVNTGLAKRPINRFPSITPILEPEQAASIILEAVRRNESAVFVPRHLLFLFQVVSLLPRTAREAIFDFMQVGVEEHE